MPLEPVIRVQVLRRQFRNALPRVPQMLNRISVEAGDILLRRIRRMLSGERLKSRTGALLKGFHWVRTGPGRGEIRSDELYWQIHEHGGIIRARTGHVLRFQKEGRTVITRQVRIAARHIVRDSVAQSRAGIRSMARAQVRGLFK